MTRVEVAAAPVRARCAVVTGALSPRVLRAEPDGARVALVATGALLLGGDEVAIDVVVGAGAWLEVVETAGTVAYPGPRAAWHVRAQVGAGGVLAWEGLPFVVADGADVERTLRLELDDGARAVLRETTVLGRAGERGGALRTRTAVTLGSRPLFVEDLDLAPASRKAPGVLGANRVIDAVSAFGFRPPLAEHPGRCRAGEAGGNGDAGLAGLPPAHRLDLAGPGAVARRLAREAHAALGLEFGAWREAALRTS